MDLREFLGYFDFDYDFVSPGGEYETRIRQELVENGDLSPEDANKDLISLIDLQYAYFGDIDKERYPVASDSVKKIIDRMDAYINDSVIGEFVTALEDRDVDTSSLSLEDMITNCKELGVGDGEVSYVLAEAVVHPETVYIAELQAPVRSTAKEVVSLADKIQLAEGRLDDRQSEVAMHVDRSER